MDGKSSAELSLPWLWIIEYLAKFGQVKPSLLHGIIKVAPETPVHLGENMEEVISLRCLEELCGPKNGNMNGSCSSLESKDKFDTSQSCKNVLQCMLHNGSASDLGVTANELLKWDLHSFLIHKRASVPKTALEELKDTILGGTHPHADSLKELSGLAHVSHLDRTAIHNGRHTGLTCGSDVGDAHAPNTVDEPNLVSRPANHKELLEGDDDIWICPPTKRNHTDVHAENPERNSNENRHHDAHSDAKRAKQQDSDEIKDRDKSPGVLTGRLGTEKIDGCSEREMANLVEDHLGHVDEDHLVGDGRHYVQPRTCDVVSDGMERGFSVDDSTRIHESREKTKNGKSAWASQWGQTCTCNVEDYVVHVAGEEMSSDGDESRKEEMDVTMKKNEFLDSQSQCLSSHNASATVDWSEQNVCMKCNEGGQLLVCNTSSCPLMVHENCVGLSAMFDDNGRFYCPFCAYSIAISEYHDAKKEASSARRSLSAFIRAGFKHQQENLDRMEQSLSGNGTSEIDRVNGHNEMDVNGHQFQGNESDGEQDDPSQQCDDGDADLPSREEEEMVRGRASTDAAEFLEGKWNRENKSNMVEKTSTLEKQMDENMVQEQPVGQVLEREQDQVLENNLFVNGDVAYENTYIVPENQTDEVRDEQDVLSKDATDKTVGKACANTTAEETSEDEDNETSISNYRISFRGRRNQEEALANPLFMQNEAPLSGEEEQTPEPTSRPEPNSDSPPSGELRPLSLPLPSKHISRFSSRGRCLKTYASSVGLRRSARIRSFARPSRERTQNDAIQVIKID